jgi:hypothetical protein
MPKLRLITNSEGLARRAVESHFSFQVTAPRMADLLLSVNRR